MNPRRRELSTGLLALSASAWLGPTSALAGTPGAHNEPGLVLPLAGDAAAWDSQNVSCPRVLRFGPHDYRMWYYGRDAAFDPEVRLPTGRIGFARSRDGIHWQRVRGPATRGAVMDPSTDRASFDSSHVGVGEIQRTEGGFEMWYFGGDNASMQFGAVRMRGFPLRIGRARSRDGLHWQRVAGPMRGAVLDVGPAGAVDAGSVGWPQVLKIRGDLWRMYYHTVSREIGFAVCAAESDDQGRSWRRLGVVLGRGAPGQFDVAGASTRQVLRRGDRYVMLYEGWGADGRPSIGIADSDDGLQWRRIPGPLPDGAILAPAAADSGRWDGGAIGTPWLVERGHGSYFMYYVGRGLPPADGDENQSRYQIGLAVSEDPQWRVWRRWTANES